VEDKNHANDLLFDKTMFQIKLFAAIAILLAIASAYIITRSIIKQVGAEPGTLVDFSSKVAAGDLQSHLELRDNDDSSIAANLIVMVQTIRNRIEEGEKIANETMRIKIALDNVATNVMIADNERNIIYMNKSIGEMLSKAEADVRKVLPNFNVARLMGSNIDQFHKNPAHQKNLLGSFTNNHKAQIVSVHAPLHFLPIRSSTRQVSVWVVWWNGLTSPSNLQSTQSLSNWQVKTCGSRLL